MGLRDLPIWRYRYLLYAAAIGYYGIKAGTKAYRAGCAPQSAQTPGASPQIGPDGGQEITLPDGQKARMYDVDAFMKLHGQAPGKDANAVSPVQLAPNAKDAPAPSEPGPKAPPTEQAPPSP